jgi:glycosyltransferase involved in cell wall biosynthesis
MMKIGIVSPFMPHDVADLLDGPSREQLADIRGVSATSVKALVRGWMQRGHQLSVFCLDPSVTRVHVLRGDGLSIHVIPKRRTRRCVSDFYRTECRLIRELVCRESPEVLSAQWTYDHAWAALQCGIPTAVTCHDAPLCIAWISKHWFTSYHLVMAWRVIRKANRLVCVSPYTAKHIQKYFLPQCPVDIVPNGELPEVFQRGERRLRKVARSERPFTFCSVGSWGRLKNISMLLKAFARVCDRQPSSRLALFGRDLGPGQAAEQWARRHNLHDGVVFNGSTPHEKILDFLETEADLMVHPSLIEANPLVLIEAMACGVPVIAGRNSGGVAWTLDEGRCGFLCDIRDERALVKTMIEALCQPDGNRALVERAWDFAKRRFNLELAVITNEHILKKLSAQSRKIT